MRYAVVLKKRDKNISLADFNNLTEAKEYKKELVSKQKKMIKVEIIKHFYPLYL